MTEDYDVLSMSENDDFTDTDASTDDADATGSDINSTISRIDSGSSNGVMSLSSSDMDDDTDSSQPGGVRKRESRSRGTSKQSRDSPPVDQDEFKPIASSDTISMYRLPRISSGSRGDTEASDEDSNAESEHVYEYSTAEVEPSNARSWKEEIEDGWKLSYTWKQPANRTVLLSIAVFGRSESLVRKIIQGMVPAMPGAQFLWVRTTAKGKLIASGYAIGRQEFYHDPSLPSKRHIEENSIKLIKIITYDVDSGSQNATVEQRRHQTGSDTVLNGISWDKCPVAPVVPITTKFLGGNYLNKRAGILASLDAPMLCSSYDTYTPLTVDYVSLIEAKMLLAMDSNGTVTSMTTPAFATTPARWPATLPKAEMSCLRRLRWALTTLVPLVTMWLFAIWWWWHIFNQEANVPEPGPHDLQIWKPEPSNLLSNLVIKTPDSYSAYCQTLSVAVARSGSALVSYIHTLHLEAIRLFEELREQTLLYTAQGRALVNEALESETATNLKRYAAGMGHELDTKRKALWDSIEDNEVVQRAWHSCDMYQKQASEQLAQLYQSARNSETAESLRAYQKQASEQLAHLYTSARSETADSLRAYQKQASEQLAKLFASARNSETVGSVRDAFYQYVDFLPQ